MTTRLHRTAVHAIRKVADVMTTRNPRKAMPEVSLDTVVLTLAQRNLSGLPVVNELVPNAQLQNTPISTESYNFASSLNKSLEIKSLYKKLTFKGDNWKRQ